MPAMRELQGKSVAKIDLELVHRFSLQILLGETGPAILVSLASSYTSAVVPCPDHCWRRSAISKMASDWNLDDIGDRNSASGAVEGDAIGRNE